MPWYIYPKDAEMLAFAGVWQDWERDGVAHRTCAIVTTSANPKMSAIHHRQPVTLTADHWPLWLGEAGHGAAPLMTAAPAHAMEI